MFVSVEQEKFTLSDIPVLCWDECPESEKSSTCGRKNWPEQSAWTRTSLNFEFFTWLNFLFGDTVLFWPPEFDGLFIGLF